MFILIDIFGREFEFENTDPLVIYNTDGNPIDINRNPIFHSQFMPDLTGSQLVKYVPQSEETNIIIPDGVIEIFSSAFENCTAISSVRIPSSVRRIKAFAFAGCTSLTNIVFLSNATEVDDTAFVGCKSLKNEDGLVIINGTLFDCFNNSSSIEIPDNVHTIGACAFNNCNNLREISIPYSVKEIRCGAFRGCVGLADNDGFIIVRDVLHDYINKTVHVAIPNGVRAVKGNALASCCKECRSLTFPGSIDEITRMTTLGGRWSKLESIAISDGTRTIKMSFNCCPNLQTVIIPQSVTAIENSFLDCPNLTIHAPANGFGIQYAKENAIQFIEEQPNE